MRKDSRTWASRPTLREAFDAIPPAEAGDSAAVLLADNVQAWTSRWALLADSASAIDAAYFILERDVFGFAFIGHLLKRQTNGVTVRLMIDAMADPSGLKGFKAHLALGKDSLQELVHLGAKVRIYHPTWQRLFKPLSLSVLASNHDKLLVVDGMRAITGGRNISRDYFVDHADLPRAWIDADTEITGATVAAALTTAFDIEFERGSVVTEVRGDVHNRVPRDLELIGAYCLMDIALHNERTVFGNSPQEVAKELLHRAVARLPAEGIQRQATRAEIEHLSSLASELAGYPSVWGAARRRHEVGFGPSGGHGCQVKVVDQSARSGGRVNRIASALVGLVAAARDSIRIENPYVVLTEEMLATLESAARRGVSVKIGTNSWVSTDSRITQGFFLADWPYILARIPAARIFVVTGTARLHAKVATIDDDVTIVSTYNLDFLSGFVNGEVAAVIWSKGINQVASASFQQRFESGQATAEEYRIHRDAAGRPVLRAGQAIGEFGPEQHLDPAEQRHYRRWRMLCNVLRLAPWLRSLRRRPLVEVPHDSDGFQPRKR